MYDIVFYLVFSIFIFSMDEWIRQKKNLFKIKKTDLLGFKKVGNLSYLIVHTELYIFIILLFSKSTEIN